MNMPFTPVELTDQKQNTVVGQAASHAETHRLDLMDETAFANLRYGNSVKCFTTGMAYYNDLYDAMKGAKKHIFIAGWQIDWDVELKPGVRLIDLLREKVLSSESFRVFVMPWMSPKIGLNTGDLATMLAIFQLNAGRKSLQAICCPSGTQCDFTGIEKSMFSHHQKLVVIDNKIGYIGGIDLAYGRRDDERFSLDPGKRKFKERYNPGVPPMHQITPKDGRCLSATDLLCTTFTFAKWNIGGNTEPGALSKFFSSAMDKAEWLSLKAVESVNAAAAGIEKTKEAVAAEVRVAAKATTHAASASLDVAVAAANSVSRQCAAMQVPDFYNGVKQYKVGTQPTSTLPDSLRQSEKDMREGWNSVIDQIPEFLSPLSRLRKVRSTPHSSIPGALERLERDARNRANVIIDATAALAGQVQRGAEATRLVCVEIGPAMDAGAKKAKVAVRTAAANAQREIEEGVNVFQRALIAEVNEIRALVSEHIRVAGVILRLGVTEGTSLISQDFLEDAIGTYNRFCKNVYAAQLAVSWLDAEAHPLLFNPETKSAVDSVLSETQPRQPWQDVHCRIEGPAVDDIALNFIRRWNASNTSYLAAPKKQLNPQRAIEGLLAPVGTALHGAWSASKNLALHKLALIGKEFYPQPRKALLAGDPRNGVAVRVLRSAPEKMCRQESEAEKKKGAAVKAQHEILDTMVSLIRGATDFIYIENQFFQTDFEDPSFDPWSASGAARRSAPMKHMISSLGSELSTRITSSGGAPHRKTLPKNIIGKTLAERIAMAIRWDQPFHVYLVLPVHPEGKLSDLAIAGQIHWTMQSLVFASGSLVNQIRRAIFAKRNCKRPMDDGIWASAWEAAGQEAGNGYVYDEVTDEEWAQYLTLLNLRNCQHVGGRLCTEQIYVHSKLMIVDDRHIIMGSANINDRSLSGSRDSEIAVMLLDTAEAKRKIRDLETTVNPLARNLRMDLWRKHLALAGNGNEIVGAASSLSTLIETPAAQATIKAIQELATSNAELYSRAFPYVPWSKSESSRVGGEGASLWPPCSKGGEKSDAAKVEAEMPFDERFWTSNSKESAPKGIRGFFTALPTYWTSGENNQPGKMSTVLLTQSTPVKNSEVGERDVVNG